MTFSFLFFLPTFAVFLKQICSLELQTVKVSQARVNEGHMWHLRVVLSQVSHGLVLISLKSGAGRFQSSEKGLSSVLLYSLRIAG